MRRTVLLMDSRKRRFGKGIVKKNGIKQTGKNRIRTVEYS